jgi:hypothetical protein
MRPIDYDKKLTEDDITWIRQAGFLDAETRISRNAERFGTEVPEVETPEDTTTRSALDPSATAGDLGPNVPGPIDPTNPEGDGASGEDDYETWKVAELENECNTRDPKAEVVATGANGPVKPDFIKALRLWDQEHPEVFED